MMQFSIIFRSDFQFCQTNRHREIIHHPVGRTTPFKVGPLTETATAIEMTNPLREVIATAIEMTNPLREVTETAIETIGLMTEVTETVIGTIGWMIAAIVQLIVTATEMIVVSVGTSHSHSMGWCVMRKR